MIYVLPCITIFDHSYSYLSIFFNHDCFLNKIIAKLPHDKTAILHGKLYIILYFFPNQFKIPCMFTFIVTSWSGLTDIESVLQIMAWYFSTRASGVGVITLRPRQNGRHFRDNIFKCIFLNQNVWILISLIFSPRVELAIFQHWFR